MSGYRWRKKGSPYDGSMFIPARDNKKEGDNISGNNYISTNKSGKIIGGGYPNSIRVPSLKRNLYTWKNFYHNFPDIYKDAKESGDWTYKGNKLKKLNIL